MNTFLPSRYDERILRGAVALQLWDGARDSRLRDVADVLIEREDAELPQWSLDQAIGDPVERDTDDDGRYRFPKRPTRRRAVNLHAVLYPQPLPPGRPAPKPKVAFEVRIVDPRWRYVPRRVRVPIPEFPDADAAGQPFMRIRRTALYAGPAYHLVSGSAGVRGRVMFGGAPVRWARVIVPAASGVPTDPPRAVAHGDDKGEFLLIIPPSAARTLAADRTFTLPITIGRRTLPLTAAELLAIKRDRISDLPLEPIAPAQVLPGTVPPQPAPDRVAMGWAMPAGYTTRVFAPVKYTAGHIHSQSFTF